MQTRSDHELLRDYAVSRSEAAFGEIVRRYADFVYSAALRQTGHAEQARDVAQTVFVDLARKAGSLRANTVLIGWLCQGARLAALEQRRKDQRRSQRERQAMDLLDSSAEGTADWQAVQPVLDEAIASLGREDRDALLLRFFKNESLAVVGTTLGVSEDAAQKRVARALEKLRGFLAQRGITTSAAALSAAMLANAVKGAPNGFAGALAAGAMAKAAASSTVPFLKLFTMTNMKTATLLLALAGGLASLTFFELHSQRQLRDARDRAQRQSAEIDALRGDNERLAAMSNELEQARRDARDVLRLRGEMAQLRRDLADRKSIFPSVTPSPTNNAPEPARVQIVVKSRFIVMPDEYATGNLNGMLTDDQLETVLQSLANRQGTRVVGEPQVLTLSGRQASMMIGQSIPWDGAYTNVGLMLDVLPICPPDSSVVELNYNAQLRRLIDGSSQKDGSLPLLESRSFTNSIPVPDGQTAVTYGVIPAGSAWFSDDSAADTAQSRTLMIFLTPTIVDAAGNRVSGREGSATSGVATNTPLASVPAEGMFPGVFPAQQEAK